MTTETTAEPGHRFPSITGTVFDIPDVELLGRAVRSGRRVKSGGQPRWVRVMDMFGLGSTYAHQLCRRYGMDPDEMVSRR